MTQRGMPSGIEIASLRQQEETSRNLMLPGNGTPWEDRGALGLIRAFLKTCWLSLTRHGVLLDHIRRPETTREATLFASGCALIWAISFGIWDSIQYERYASNPSQWEIDGSRYALESIIQCVVIGVLVILLLRISAGVYNRLIAGGTAQNRVPGVLTYNTFAYSLGPSLLAIVPLFGWALSIIWITVDLIIAGRARLYLRSRDAVINAFLVIVVDVVVCAGVWLVCWVVWQKLLMGQPSVVPTIPLTAHHQ